MGTFTKKFKFMTRHKNADFSREKTIEHWKRELVELMIRSGLVRFKDDDFEDNKNMSDCVD